MKCGMICLSNAAQLPGLNGRKRSPTFHSTFPILFITKIFGENEVCTCINQFPQRVYFTPGKSLVASLYL